MSYLASVTSGRCGVWLVSYLASVVSGKILRSTALIHFGRPEQSPGIYGRSLPDLKNPVDSFSATRIFGLLAVSLPNEDSGSDIQNRFSSKHSGSMRTNFQFPKHCSPHALFNRRIFCWQASIKNVSQLPTKPTSRHSHSPKYSPSPPHPNRIDDFQWMNYSMSAE